MVTQGGVVILANLESLGRYRVAFKVVLILGVHFLFIHLCAWYICISGKRLGYGTPAQPYRNGTSFNGPQSSPALAETANLISSGTSHELASNEC